MNAPVNTPVADAAGWRTMDSAPKDGTEVLAFGFRQYSVVAWRGEQWGVYTDNGWFGSDGWPTHWQPLPPPPESGT